MTKFALLEQDLSWKTNQITCRFCDHLAASVYPDLVFKNKAGEDIKFDTSYGNREEISNYVSDYNSNIISLLSKF